MVRKRFVSYIYFSELYKASIKYPYLTEQEAVI